MDKVLSESATQAASKDAASKLTDSRDREDAPLSNCVFEGLNTVSLSDALQAMKDMSARKAFGTGEGIDLSKVLPSISIDEDPGYAPGPATETPEEPSISERIVQGIQDTWDWIWGEEEEVLQPLPQPADGPGAESTEQVPSGIDNLPLPEELKEKAKAFGVADLRVSPNGDGSAHVDVSLAQAKNLPVPGSSLDIAKDVSADVRANPDGSIDIKNIKGVTVDVFGYPVAVNTINVKMNENGKAEVSINGLPSVEVPGQDIQTVTQVLPVILGN